MPTYGEIEKTGNAVAPAPRSPSSPRSRAALLAGRVDLAPNDQARGVDGLRRLGEHVLQGRTAVVVGAVRLAGVGRRWKQGGCAIEAGGGVQVERSPGASRGYCGPPRDTPSALLVAGVTRSSCCGRTGRPPCSAPDSSRVRCGRPPPGGPDRSGCRERRADMLQVVQAHGALESNPGFGRVLDGS